MTFNVTCCTFVRADLPEGWKSRTAGRPAASETTLGIKKVNIRVDVKTVATLQHLLLPSLIFHTARCPLPLTCNLFHCPWSSLMLYSQNFLYALPLVSFALLFSYKCDALCLMSPVTQMPVMSVCLHVSPCSLNQIQSTLCPVRCMAFYSYLTVLMVHIGMEAMQCAGSTVHWTRDLLTSHTNAQAQAHILRKCMLIHVR